MSRSFPVNCWRMPSLTEYPCALSRPAVGAKISPSNDRCQQAELSLRREATIICFVVECAVPGGLVALSRKSAWAHPSDCGFITRDHEVSHVIGGDVHVQAGRNVLRAGLTVNRNLCCVMSGADTLRPHSQRARAGLPRRGNALGDRRNDRHYYRGSHIH